MSQFYGTAGKLATPVTIDSVAYGYFVRFDNAPDGADPLASLVLSARLTSWSRSGANVLGVVERQRLVGAILNIDNQEIEQFYFTGDTLGAAIEPQRFYSKQSPQTAIRGGRRAAKVGHTIRFPDETEFHRAAFPTVAVETYAVSAAPRWQQGEPARARYTFPVLMNEDAIISEDATQVIQFTPGPATGDAGVAMFDLVSSEYEPSQRVIFDSDAGYYPADATFPGTDAHGEYWYDETLTAVTFASQNEDLSDVLGDTYDFVWYTTATEAQEDADRMVIETDAGGAGYGALDEVVLLTRFVDGSVWTEYLDIYRLADGSWPEFSVEVRDALNSEAEAVGFDVVGGEITQYRKKSGGTWTVTAITPLVLDASDAFFRIIIDRTSATSINFILAPLSSSSVGIHEFTSLTLATSAWLSVAVYDEQAVPMEINVSPQADVTWFVNPLSAAVSGTLKVRNSREVTAVFTQTFDLQDAEPIDEVYNLTAGTVMTESATPARDHYTLGTGTITFYAESDRDQIRITHDPGAAGDPDAVGLAPEQFVPSTKNLATSGNSTAGANRAYWQDRITFADPEELFDAPQDAEFEIHAEGSWDPAALPSLFYSYKGNASATWTDVSTNALPLPGPKVFLIKTSWVEGLSEPIGKLCFQMRGTRVLAQGSVNGERQINVLIRSLQAFDDCWLKVDITGGGAGFGCLISSALYVGGSEFECHDVSCWRPTEFAWGQSPNTMPTPAQWPYLDGGTIKYRTASFTPSNDILTCGAAERVVGEAIQDGLAVLNVQLNNPFAYNLFGSTPGPWPETPQSFTAGGFFSAVSVGIPKALRKLPLQILEAYGVVNFTNLTSNYGTFDPAGGTSASGLGGTIHWQLVGLKRKRRTIRNSAGNPTTIREWSFNTYGASISGSAAEGPTVYNALPLLEALLTARGDGSPEHILMPSTGLTSGSADGLKNYLLSLFPDGGLSASVGTADGCDVTVDYSVPWRQYSFDQVSIHSIIARVRLPTGLLDHRAFPKVRPALVPY